jgi:hydroxyethylthiazole kinase-like uncharacterized protein yjeF
VIYLLTPAEMQAADTQASLSLGQDALMRNAGARIAEWIRLHVGRGSRVVAFAGPGNNGGDAIAAFEALGAEYECLLVRDLPKDDERARSALAGTSLAIDALYGTGARLPMPDEARPAMRALRADHQPTLAIDIPTGIDALTGARGPDAVQASATITLGALKPGLLLEPARANAGDLWLGEIGIDDDVLQAHAKTFRSIDDGEFLSLLPRRASDAEKRSAGAPLILAGSQQFPGAAVLCARAAARAGAGYVTVATTRAAAESLRAHLIEQVVVTFASGSAKAAAEDLADIARRNESIAIGPGLGLDDWTGKMLRAFVERIDLPFVLDASGLFHFSKHLELLREKNCVLTPHAGEFARLSGKGTIRDGERVERLREFVHRTGITTLLKGSDTLVYDGTAMHVNPVSSNVLATAGTGDVLSGMIATLLSQGRSPFDAARAAAYWHGRAGRYCASQRRVGVVASDIHEALGAALPRAARADRLRQLS